MAAPTYIREDAFIIQAVVPGIHLPDVWSWQSKEGGDIETEIVKARPGGLLGQISMGGPGQRTDCTVKRLYTAELHAFIPQLEAAAGNARMIVSWQPLGYNPITAMNQTVARPQVLTGYLKTVTVPTVDASATAAATIALVMSCDQFQQGSGA